MRTRKSRLPGVGTRPASAAPVDPQHYGEVPARPRRRPRTLWEPRRRCRGNRASGVGAVYLGTPPPSREPPG
jgi:hypothetical protein